MSVPRSVAEVLTDHVTLEVIAGDLHASTRARNAAYLCGGGEPRWRHQLGAESRAPRFDRLALRHRTREP